jgi:hypothetical protein
VVPIFADPKFALGGVIPGPMTVSARLVVVFNEPDVPVTVTLYIPVATELLTVRVNALVPVAGLGVKDAVTPVGSPDAARFTLPVKPL